MPAKLRSFSLPKDDLAWEKNDEDADAWEMSINKASVFDGVANLILKYRPGNILGLHRPIRGGYNIIYRLEYEDGSIVCMRIPIRGIVKFPDEKVRCEVATMRLVAAETSIPVPHIYHSGSAAKNPVGLGPFIIMDWVDYDMTMSDALKDPFESTRGSHILNPDISEKKLRYLYRQMASILLQLSTLKFPRIGSINEDEDGTFSVSGRPITQNMNSLMEFTGAPPSLCPPKARSSSHTWYADLADMHLKQLLFQHNDAAEDEEKVRDGYVARQLFRRLASERRLAPGLGREGDDGVDNDYILFSEDLRPSNVLVDRNLRVVAVIDWEFAYAAPAQFSYDPPWWLLLKSPENWPGGYDLFMKEYEPRLDIFLEVLEEEEKKLAGGYAGITSAMADLSLAVGSNDFLSSRMRRSWEDKTWILNYAARNSWAFDFLFWRYLDSRFLGPGNDSADYHARLKYLSPQQRDAMETFVNIKMEESLDRTLVDWDHESAVTHLAQFMV